MRIKLAAVFFTAVICAVPAVAIADSTKQHAHEYYLALGGSLSRGSQPNAQGKSRPTNRGYTNDLYAAEKPNFKHLKLVELGCPGETTTTMIKGGICKYAAGSQLAAAVQFLHKHKGHMAFVTIDIGANDITPCVSSRRVSQRCFKKADRTIQANLPVIAKQLRKAAGKKVPIISSTYYDPWLASWLISKRGQKAAASSRPLVKDVNKQITSYFGAKAFEIAPVAGAFHTYEPLSKKKPYRHRQVPVSVIVVCKKTWMCAPSPWGPNIHANTAGYLKIAKVFEKETL